MKLNLQIACVCLFISGLCLSNTSGAIEPDLSNWQTLEKQASGQTVYFNAWGGETRINRYLVWASKRVKTLYNIDLRHVKITDTAQAVSRIIAEKQAGNSERGAIDLLWINGENFSALKQNALLYGPWAEVQPNFSLVDADRFPEMREDFTIATEGFESPWTRSQLVFYYDSDVVTNAPGSIKELLQWAQDHPSEFTYPRPPSFLGSTFLKQALLELAQSSEPLYRHVEESDFALVTAPLWKYLDALHPHLLRSGRYFPLGSADLRRFMGDGETSLAFSFNPNEASLGILNGELPESVRSYVLDGGTLDNVSFLAIPFNAQHKAAAIVVSNFLLSAEAQARGSNQEYMGSTSVLSMQKLSSEFQQLFLGTAKNLAAASVEDLDRKILEPHPSWTTALERAWIQRYGAR